MRSVADARRRLILHVAPFAAPSGAEDALRGTIYFEIDETIYPKPNWSDNIGALLALWTAASDSLEEGETRVIWPFMEGPFFIELRGVEAAQIELKFVIDAHRRIVVTDKMIGSTELRGILKAAVSKALRAARAAGIQTADILFLARRWGEE